MMRAIVIAVALSACRIDGWVPPDHCHDPDVAGAYADTEDRWVDLVGEIPADCLESEIRTELVSPDDWSICTKSEGFLLGCSNWMPLEWAYLIQARECRPVDETYNTLMHERAHTLLHCIYGDLDGDHLNQAVWGPVAAGRAIDGGCGDE